MEDGRIVRLREMRKAREVMQVVDVNIKRWVSIDSIITYFSWLAYTFC